MAEADSVVAAVASTVGGEDTRGEDIAAVTGVAAAATLLTEKRGTISSRLGWGLYGSV